MIQIEYADDGRIISILRTAWRSRGTKQGKIWIVPGDMEDKIEVRATHVKLEGDMPVGTLRLPPTAPTLHQQMELFQEKAPRPETLIVRRAIGDTLMAFHAIEAYQKATGETIVYATDAPLIPLCESQPFISESVDIKEVNSSCFAKTINLEGMVDYLPACTQKPRVDLFADCLGVPMPESKGYIRLDDNLRSYAERMLSSVPRPIVALQPLSKSILRRWGKEKQLVEQLPEISFVILSNMRLDSWSEYTNVLNASGMTSIMEMAALIDACDAGVFPDSAGMHIAGNMNVPCIGLFGGIIPPEFRISHYQSVEPIATEPQCGDCSVCENLAVGINMDQFQNCGVCPSIPCFDWQTGCCKGTKHYRWCMDAISADTVIEEIDKILSKEI